MDELKPCPFCGSTNVSLVRFDNGRTFDGFVAQCEYCGVATEVNKNAVDAVNTWNKRVYEK